MFNVGIIAQPSIRPVNLTDRQLELWSVYYDNDEYGNPLYAYGYRITFSTDGALRIGVPGTIVGGEWYVPTTSGIGAGYQVRATHEAGDPLHAGSSSVGSWLALSSTCYFGWEAVGNPSPPGGRVKIEIRDVATSTIQASARIWTPGYSP